MCYIYELYLYTHIHLFLNSFKSNMLYKYSNVFKHDILFINVYKQLHILQYLTEMCILLSDFCSYYLMWIQKNFVSVTTVSLSLMKY